MKKIFLLYCCLLVVQLSVAQNTWRVFGTVIAEDDNMPVIGASVFIKGGTPDKTNQGTTNQGTVTNQDGKFELNIPSGATIVISYIGYKSHEQQISSDRQVLQITLTVDAYVLEEVVAVGYGSLKKSDLTGAIASVQTEQLQKTPAAGLDQALQGRVAGVTVNADSGQPGAAAEIRIRGIGTVNNSAPIYVVDGVITEDISFLSPNDILSTEILKDASSTAIFGSRGANGVILISTIKGGKGKANISFNSYFGVQNRWNKLDLMQRDEFAETLQRINPKASSIALYQQEGFNAWMRTNIGTSPYYPMLKTATNPYGMDYASIETDWQDEVFVKDATIQNYHLSLTGGNEKDNYAFSAGYFNQNGTIAGSNYERLTLRVNSSHQIRKWLKVGENLSFVNSTGRNAMNNSSSPGASVLSAAIAMAPWDPTHYPQETINNRGKDLSGQISAASNYKNVTNPFSMVEHNHPEDIVERWFGDVYLEITPMKHFTWRSSVSLDLSNNRNKSFGDAYRYSTYDGREKNFLSSEMQHYRTLTFDNIATYSIDAGKHALSIMAGQTTSEYNSYTMGGAGASILNPVEENLFLKNTTEEKTYSSDGVNRSRMFSLLGRLHYTFNSRYMITLNFRADASNKFPENPWGYFPSTALAWRVSEEDWMKDMSALDFLKLRFGWGQIGNEKIDSDDGFRSVMSEGSNVFVGYPFGVTQELANGATLLNIANKGGRWEYTEQWNAGLDFGIYRGLLSGTLDAFIRDTHDMILSVKAPAHVGNRFDPMKNVGTVRNKGIELTLEHRHKIGSVNYNLNGNISWIDNELIALNGGSPVYGDRVLSNEGLALFTFWGYTYEGIYKTDQEALEHLWSYTPGTIGVHAGDAKYKDISGAQGVPDGKIDDYDKADLGNPFPWLTYGLNIGADYRNFDLQLFFQGVYGNKIYNAVRHRTEGAGNEATLSTAMRDVWIDYSDVMKSSMTAYGIDWQPLINPDGTIPNPVGNPMNRETSSRLIEDGAYFRLKNIQLGYTIPRHITQKWDIDRCRLYVSASNLFTLTAYTGYDPEIGSGVDYGNYPQARTLMLGINLDF